MPRVLTCIDPVPAIDGTCTTSAWLEFPTVLPTLTIEEGRAIGWALFAMVAGMQAIKLLRKAIP